MKTILSRQKYSAKIFGETSGAMRCRTFLGGFSCQRRQRRNAAGWIVVRDDPMEGRRQNEWREQGAQRRRICMCYVLLLPLASTAYYCRRANRGRTTTTPHGVPSKLFASGITLHSVRYLPKTFFPAKKPLTIELYIHSLVSGTTTNWTS